jgi:hypothetical protein
VPIVGIFNGVARLVQSTADGLEPRGVAVAAGEGLVGRSAVGFGPSVDPHPTTAATHTEIKGFSSQPVAWVELIRVNNDEYPATDNSPRYVSCEKIHPSAGDLLAPPSTSRPCCD